VDHHETGVQAALLDEERRQAERERGVDEALGPPFGDRREVGGGGGHVVANERDGRAVEVSSGDQLPFARPPSREDHRVVGRGVHFDREDGGRVRGRVADGAVDLRSAAEGVGVLHLVAAPVALADPGAQEKRSQVRRRGRLSRMRARRVDPRVKGGVRPLSASVVIAATRSAARRRRRSASSASAPIAVIICVR